MESFTISNGGKPSPVGPVDNAVDKGDFAAVRKLLNNGRKPTYYSLYRASARGDADIVKLLHDRGAPYIIWVETAWENIYGLFTLTKGTPTPVKPNTKNICTFGGIYNIIHTTNDLDKSANISPNYMKYEGKLYVSPYLTFCENEDFIEDEWTISKEMMELNAECEDRRRQAL